MEISHFVNTTVATTTTKTTATQSDTEQSQSLPMNDEQSSPRSQSGISQDWQLIDESIKDLKNTDDFDAEKVAQLRQSLENGTFDLDVSQIATSMLRQHGPYGNQA